MKNSKPFPCPAWLGEEFLSPPELRSCRTLFRDQGAGLTLTVIDLARLQAELLPPGHSVSEVYLHRTEQVRLASFGFAKRQLEWLGGRLAAKHAALSLLAREAGPLPGYRELAVEPDAAGRPYLADQGGTNASLPAISISHSHGYAGALAVWGPSCGLDLQLVTPRVLTVQERFASREEVAILHTSPYLETLGEAARLTLLWSAKEALRKSRACEPLLGFTELTLSRLEVAPPAGLVGHFSCRRPGLTLGPVFLTIADHFALAITVQPATSQNTA